MKQLLKTADKVEKSLTAKGISLTMGGEPSYVPENPSGPEWNVSAVGPTKLNYAYQMAAALIADVIPNGVVFYSPGKSYPGEVNPRWALHLVWRRDFQPFAKQEAVPVKKGAPSLATMKAAICKACKLRDEWITADNDVAVLPIDFIDGKWQSDAWPFADKKMRLLGASGPAGLRLPLGELPPESLHRALVLEPKKDGLHIFLPPLLQDPFVALFSIVTQAAAKAGFSKLIYEGYVPSDTSDVWEKLSLTPDPGVLEINLPPCLTWKDYQFWLQALERAAKASGMRSFKKTHDGEETGTGGGNHLLFGGPDFDHHPFFKRPAWVASIVRYWQHHPSLSYLFTGTYVGASSQAPRPDESTRELYDLEMAYRFLESLPDGDHRYLISETLRHLHTDTSGNTHRSEISVDKFWNVNADGGCRGLIEFRAVESLPHAEWMSAVALLWKALAAMLLAKPFKKPLLEHGSKLYDHYFLPSVLWNDFSKVLADLEKAGFPLPEKTFQDIWNWRFPEMLHFSNGTAALSIRKACEGWPLLCETPHEGGSTSRFVDTSMERLEFVGRAAFAKKYRIFVQGRELPLEPLPGKLNGVGLRYRRTALYPSLHPGIAPHLPLYVELISETEHRTFVLETGQRSFHSVSERPKYGKATPCRKMRAELITCDLRLP